MRASATFVLSYGCAATVILAMGDGKRTAARDSLLDSYSEIEVLA